MRIGLIGNPNVGKSTIFNALTGMHQHTGNWPGKTVEKATGYIKYKGQKYEIEDLPGTYSLTAHSKEEEVTRNFVYFGKYDALIVVCDAVCLERNLNLVLQILEVTNKVVVCVNLMDEALKKGIKINIKKLEEILKVPVIASSARSGKGIDKLLESLTKLKEESYCVTYNEYLENEIKKLNPLIDVSIKKNAVSLRLIAGEIGFIDNFKNKGELNRKLEEIWDSLYKKGINKDDIKVLIAEDITEKCQEISNNVVTFANKNYQKKDRILDKILTGKVTGYLFMILLLMIIFWITIEGANYISDFLYNFLFSIDDYIEKFLKFIHIPDIVVNCIVYGVYRVLAWVVAVMLPPMAIFFPLFTLLEDLGYLPRIAFKLDNIFQKCGSCGKQALTMAMGFGCNAVGVMGSRIIDSPRERLISILTNALVPCNGRFPILISVVSMFLIINDNNSFISAFILTLIILFSVFMTLLTSKILSKTILKGVPSSFILELPPYRMPQITKVIIRSIFDRTLFVLRRAVCISAPAGLVIWVFANVDINGLSILNHFTNILEPIGNFVGLDGVILMAFILGFPANEIVIPIMIMGYMSLNYITDFSSLSELKNLLLSNGWTTLTAICTIIFTLMHWPCLTTVFTIKKETNSLKWTILSIFIPAVAGLLVCFLIATIYNLF